MILLVSALAKLLDIPGFAEVLKTYRLFPDLILKGFGLGVSLFELALGVWLFYGRELRKSAFVALILHIIYMLWALFNLQRGLNLQNCGCFGVYLARPLTYGTVAEDFALTLICGLLFWSAQINPDPKEFTSS